MSEQLERIMAWVQEQPDLRAVLMVGSRAQTDQQPDEFADYDLHLYTTEPERYRTFAQDVARRFGDLWIMLPETRDNGAAGYLLLYVGSHKYDLTFIDLSELQAQVTSGNLDSILERGYEILYDPDNVATQLHPPTGKPDTPDKPTAEEFQRVVERFWYGAVSVAKQIRRRNLWKVQQHDWTMKDDLLTMLEWHARYVRGIEDTWHDGQHIQEWIDEGTRVMLRYAFPHFSAGDSWRALRTTMKVFTRLAPAVASKLDYPYPQALCDDIRTYIGSLYDNDHHLGTGELS